MGKTALVLTLMLAVCACGTEPNYFTNHGMAVSPKNSPGPRAVEKWTDFSKKDLSLSLVIYAGWGVRRILAEIKKCDVLCANCHRKLHWKKRK